MSGKTGTPLQIALRYLGFRARTEAEVRKKLESSGFAEQSITTTLEQLSSYGYVNDEGLARDWTQGRAVQLGHGPGLVQRELARRGVEPPVIERVIREAFDGGKEFERARALIEARFGREDLGSIKTLQRAQALLARRGYRRSIIEEVLEPHCAHIPS